MGRQVCLTMPPMRRHACRTDAHLNYENIIVILLPEPI